MKKKRIFGSLGIAFLCLAMLLTMAPAAKADDGFQVMAGDGVEAFVTRMYKYCLGRNPDPDGLKAYCDALRGGHITGGAATKSFFLSDEYRNKNHSNAQFLTTLYKAMFDRNPDKGGFDGWMNAMNNGMGRPEVVDGFINSSEFVNLCMRYGIIPYEGFVGAKWGVLNDLCCKNGGALLYQVSMDGATKSSTTRGCSSRPTWEGYAATTPGSGKTINYLLQGCGVTVRGSGTLRATLEANKCYAFLNKISGNSLVVLIGETNCSDPQASVSGQSYELNAIDTIEIPLSFEQQESFGGCLK